MNRHPLILAILVVGLVSCTERAPGIPTPTPESGIVGVVKLWPGCPLMISGSPCPDRPWQGTVQAFSLQGELVGSAHTDKEGVFRLPLAPGVYDLKPFTFDDFPTAKLKRVSVEAGAFGNVSLRVDSGLR